jgi:hypothetical protein
LPEPIGSPLYRTGRLSADTVLLKSGTLVRLSFAIFVATEMVCKYYRIPWAKRGGMSASPMVFMGIVIAFLETVAFTGPN